MCMLIYCLMKIIINSIYLKYLGFILLLSFKVSLGLSVILFHVGGEKQFPLAFYCIEMRCLIVYQLIQVVLPLFQIAH